MTIKKMMIVIQTNELHLMSEYLEEVFQMECIDHQEWLFEWERRVIFKLAPNPINQESINRPQKSYENIFFELSVNSKNELQSYQQLASFFYYRALKKEVTIPLKMDNHRQWIEIPDIDQRMWFVSYYNV